MPVKKGPFMVCGKTGRIVGLRKFPGLGWLLPIIGLAALVWYLVRVIPKPSRATYPCQRVGAPIAFGSFTYLLSLFGLVAAFRNAKKFTYQHRYALAAICIVIGLTCSALVIKMNETAAKAEDTGTFTPSDGPNQPIGTARGIKPGRVAWDYDLSACNWNGSSSYWFSAANNDQTKITALMNKVICSVANQSSVKSSWDALFKYKNGGTAYVKGEKIAIKLNLNNGGNYDNQIDASPQSVYALLDGLVNQFGVNQTDITLCDPARENQCSVIKDYCSAAFPNINYDSNLGGFTANAFSYSVSGPTETSLSTAIVNSKYLITMAVLKRHCTPAATWGTDGVDYGNASVTMIFKSNWGNIGNNRASQHGLLHDWSYPMASYNQLVDIFGSKHINGKTVLNILDGLYSGDRWNSQPHKWQMPPFNGHWPSSFFASQDPVALESVGLDFLRSEMPLIKNGDRHLHEAALANNPPSGTVYKPDGVQLPSLGVHEHWNNASSKQYTRNLATGAGIELVNIAASYSVDITSPADGSTFAQGSNIPIQASVNNASNSITQVSFYQNGTQLLGTASASPYGITWSNAPLGGWTLTAVATDSAGLSVTSTVVNITVSMGPMTWDATPSTSGAQDGGGVWDLTSSNWWNGATDFVWTVPPTTTTFGAANGAAGTVTLGAGISVGNLTFNPAGSGDYTIAGGGFALTLANTPAISVAANCSPVISAPMAGTGFSKTGSGILTLTGANSYVGAASVTAGTLVLSGNNTGSAAGSSVSSGAVLRLAHANALKGALMLNSGSTLQLRADNDTVFSPASIAVESASDTLNFNVDSLTPGVTEKTMTLAGALTFGSSGAQTINVTGASDYTLRLGAITATTSGANYMNFNVNAPPNASVIIGSFTSGYWGNNLKLQGGGRITVQGNLSNQSNGSVLLYVNDGTVVTLQGASVKLNTGDAYSYYVQNGTLVLNNNNALINNTSGTGLNQSLFSLGTLANTSPNSANCAVYLGDATHATGGLSLGSNITNYVADGGATYPNTGTFTIGGQNTSGINTYANPIILGYTANLGKSVTLVAATGGEVDFTGKILRNGTAANGGLTIGDASHGGIVKLAGANTYVGPTTISAGTLLMNGSLAAASSVTVVGGVLGGTGTINGPVTVQSAGTLSPGGSIGTLTINNNLTLLGNLLIKVNKSSSPSNDMIAVSGILTNAGTGVLTITNLGPALVAGDTFQLFNRALLNGGALTISPPTPGARLVWTNNLALNGTLGVVPEPIATNSTSITASVSGTNLSLFWPSDHIGWILQVQTNPLTIGIDTNWMPMTNSIITNQMFVPIDPNNGSVFYRLKLP